jgi:hypothetical protein
MFAGKACRADRIASATHRATNEKMEEDTTFYHKFSDLLEETIRAYRERRLSERDYLNSVGNSASKVARKDRDCKVPEPIRGNEDALAFYGVLDAQLTSKDCAHERCPQALVEGWYRMGTSPFSWRRNSAFQASLHAKPQEFSFLRLHLRVSPKAGFM